MNKIKSILCVFLSAMMFLCCSLTASAASVTPKISFAGYLVIYATNNGRCSLWDGTGHAFLSFKNTSSSPVTLGPLNVYPGHEVTFGTWGNRGAHSGIWYNLESYYANYENDFQGRVSLLTGVTYSDLRTINSLIENNDAWTDVNNCSSFAVKIWNSISSNELSAGNPNTPTSLKASITSKPTYETNRDIGNTQPIGYVNSNGDFVYVMMSTSVQSENCENLTKTVDTSTDPVYL